MTATTNVTPTGYSEWKEKADHETDLRQASVKTTNVWISYMVGGVLASIYYGNKTRNWIPTGISTAVAVVTLPLLAIDPTTLTWSIAPAATGAAMVCTRANNKRKELGVTLPEEARYLLSKKD